MVSYSEYPQTHSVETVDEQNNSNLNHEEMRCIATLEDAKRNALVSAFADPDAEVELSDGSKKSFYEVLEEIDTGFSYDENGGGFAVSGSADALNGENLKNSPLIRMIQVVLNGMISEGSVGIYAFKNYAGSSLGRSQGAGLLDEDGYLGQHSLYAIKEYLKIVDNSDQSDLKLKSQKNTVQVLDNSGTQVAQETRISDSGKTILDANTEAKFDIFKTDAAGNVIELVKTQVDDDSRTAIWSLLEEILDKPYYANLKTVLEKVKDNFSAISVYGRKLHKIEVVAGILDDNDKLVLVSYGVDLEETEALPVNFDQEKFKEKLLSKYTAIDSDYGADFSALTEDDLQILYADDVNHTAKVKIGNYELWFDYDENNYTVTVNTGMLALTVGDAYEISENGTTIELKNKCLASLNAQYDELEVDGGGGFMGTGVNIGQAMIALLSANGNERVIGINDYQIRFQYNPSSYEVGDVVVGDKEADDLYGNLYEVQNNQTDSPKKIELFLKYRKEKIKLTDDSEVEALLPKEVMDLLVDEDGNQLVDFDELLFSTYNDNHLIGFAYHSMKANFDLTGDGRQQLENLFKSFELLPGLSTSDKEQLETVKDWGGTDGFKTIDFLQMKGGKISSLSASYASGGGPKFSEIETAGIETVFVKQVMGTDGGTILVNGGDGDFLSLQEIYQKMNLNGNLDKTKIEYRENKMVILR